jgi:hypothetical protein
VLIAGGVLPGKTSAAYNAAGGYSALPDRIPATTPQGDVYYVYFTTTLNDDNGNGAYLPRSSFKIYSDVEPTLGNGRANIKIDPSGSDCTGLKFDVYQGKPAPNESSVVYNLRWHNLPLQADCSNITIPIDPGTFTLSQRPGHQRLYVATVSLELMSQNRTIATHLNSTGGAKIGFLGGGDVTLQSANENPRRNVKQYALPFRPMCDAFGTENSVGSQLFWYDDDYGTYNGQIPDIPGDGPEDGLLPVIMGTYADTGQITLTSLDTQSTFQYSGPSTRGSTGTVPFTLYKGNSYVIAFQLVDAHNAIKFTYPFDSGDFYLGCTGWSLNGRSVVSQTAVNNPNSAVYFAHSVQNDPSSSQNADFDYVVKGSYNGGAWAPIYPFQAGTKTGVPPGTTDPNLAFIPYQFSFQPGSRPGDKFCEAIFYTNATGPNTAEANSNPACVTYSGGSGCNGPCFPTTPGCPSMPEGFQQVDPPAIGVPPDETPSQTNLGFFGVTVYGRKPTGPGGRWERRIDAVQDQYGQPAGGWLVTGYSADNFAVDYTPYMRMYPYDKHNLSVQYNVKYNEYRWVYDYPSGQYACFTGFRSGAACFGGVAVFFGVRCADVGGGTLTTSSDGVLFCLQSYLGPATQFYYPTLKNDGDPTRYTGEFNYDGAPVLDPCYQRNFTASAATGNQSLSPTYENPDTATFNYSMTATYNLQNIAPDLRYQPYTRPPGSPVRVQPQAQLNFDANYFVDRGGSIFPLPTRSTNSGSALMAPAEPGQSVTNNITDPVSPVTIPPLQAGDRVCVTVVVHDATGTMDNIAPGTVQNQSGFGAVSAGPSCSDFAVNEPYTHFSNSDVTAGAGFGASCTQSSGKIETYVNDLVRHSPPSGSGSQFAALALGQIEGLSSANIRNITTPKAPLGLTFANAGVAASGSEAPNLGGNIGTRNYCMPDYAGTLPAGTPVQTMNNVAVNSDGVANIHPGGGTLTINASSVADGTNQAIYVEGDVYISGNIIFTGADRAGRLIRDVPSLYVIAHGGNIYIDKSVTRLDGIFIAQPKNGVGGTVDTCARINGAYSTAEIYGNAYCNRQLVVNGAVVSKKLNLNRSYSSLRYAQPGEHIVHGTAEHTCGDASSQDVQGSLTAKDCAAEIFNFTPELFMSRPAVGATGTGFTGSLDSITSLSPVL